MITATIGSTYFSGNSLCPKHDTVIRFETWGELSEKERKTVRTIEYWKTEEELASREHVRYRTRGRKGTSSFPRKVFEMTRFETHEAMVEAYAKGGGA